MVGGDERMAQISDSSYRVLRIVEGHGLRPVILDGGLCFCPAIRSPVVALGNGGFEQLRSRLAYIAKSALSSDRTV